MYDPLFHISVTDSLVKVEQKEKISLKFPRKLASAFFTRSPQGASLSDYESLFNEL